MTRRQPGPYGLEELDKFQHYLKPTYHLVKAVWTMRTRKNDVSSPLKTLTNSVVHAQ